jgi:5-methylcytosine-specific restriction endonuclease McrA
VIRRVPLVTRTPLRRTPFPPRVAGLRDRRRRHVASNTPARREDLSPLRRTLLWIRAGRCELCGVPLAYEQFEAAHRQARSQGGSNTALWNRWVACPPCHRWQHAHSDAAAETGHYVRSALDPQRMPLCLPDGRVVRLGADGGYLDVP